MVEMGGSVAVDTIEEGGGGGGRSTVGGLYLNIGLQVGVNGWMEEDGWEMNVDGWRRDECGWMEG